MKASIKTGGRRRGIMGVSTTQKNERKREELFLALLKETRRHTVIKRPPHSQ
jgi:hypothetical protein